MPEKSQAGADERATENRQLTCGLKADEQQVVRQHRVAGDIRERGECRRGNAKRADSQAVEAVGEIDGIAGSDQHQHGEHDVEPP